MKKTFYLLLFSCLCFSLFAQKASDVIENGIKIISGHEVFLKFDGTKIRYQRKAMPNDLHFKQVKDSAILLPVEESVLIFMRPLNPLNFSFKGENKIIVDPIDEAAATSLKKISDLFQDPKIAKMVAAAEKTESISLNADTVKSSDKSFCVAFRPAVKMYDDLLELLKKDKKKTITETFTALKQLNFNNENETKEDIKKADETIATITAFYDTVGQNLDEFKTEVEKVTCSDDVENFVVKRVFAGAVKDLEVTLSNQKKRLTNLEKTFKLVRATQQEASANNWLIALEEVPSDRGKISLFTLKVNEAGYKLSDKEEIVEAETKEKTAKVLRFRRFQRFVPEVSIGVAYTNLSFPKYGTSTDATGKQTVAEAGEDKINKVNFTSMINYNLFLTNSPIHPFWQIGIGVNSDFPTLLTGAGFRLNVNGAKRLAIAFGLATTWIKSLDKLKVGDVVSGPADVEKDTKFKFNTKPKTYFGIQYNF